jgi:hypothetical protein
MISKKLVLSTIGGLIALASASSFAAPMQFDSNEVVAREASEAPRGADNNNHRQRRGGRVGTEDAGQFILAREASEAPRGADNNNQRRRGRNA